MSYPIVDDALARDVLDAIGATVDLAVEAIVDAFRAWLPMGTSAKVAALAEGRSPLGADPTTALAARLDGSLSSWSCWAACTGLGGVLAAAGHDVRLVVEHRRDRGAPTVDFHSVLVVDGALVDPFLGPSVPVPMGHDVSRPDGWASWVPGDRPDHIGGRGTSVFRYRQLGDHLDRRDVEAFCAVSATHSGAPRLRTAHWLRGPDLCSLKEDADGFARLVVSRGPTPWALSRTVVGTGSYDELLAGAFAEFGPRSHT